MTVQAPGVVQLAERVLREIELAVRQWPRYHKYAHGSTLRSEAMKLAKLAHRAWREPAAVRLAAGEHHHGDRIAMIKTETIIWHDCAKQMPDDDTAVLLHMPELDGDSVWPGYHDGDEGWTLADGMPAPTVARWAHMPVGAA